MFYIRDDKKREEWLSKECCYEVRWFFDSLGLNVCYVHGELSKHRIFQDSHKPCFVIDP